MNSFIFISYSFNADLGNQNFFDNVCLNEQNYCILQKYQYFFSSSKKWKLVPFLNTFALKYDNLKIGVYVGPGLWMVNIFGE